MRLTVFGGTGGTGEQLIRAALDAGHTVTAPARDPSRVRPSHERLRTVRADVLDPPSLEGTMDGADAVLSALGAASARQQTTVYSAGAANILDAMRRAGVRRFVGVTALPLASRAEVDALERLIVYPLLYRFFGGAYADMARMEQVLRRTEADWTIVRPPRLTNRHATGRYRTAVDRPLRRARTISRADLADAMLHLLDDPHAIHATVAIAH